MAPSAPIVVALFRLSSASADEQSLLQMPVVNTNIETDTSACHCPGYFEDDCRANAFQGCIWHNGDGSNEPWCDCDEEFEPNPPLYTNSVDDVDDPSLATPAPADPNVQAPAAACPSGWVQKGEIGADIGGCGLQSCGERYDTTSEAACAARCDSNSACVGFSYAPMNGDRNHPGVTACTIYNSDTPTGTWTGTQGIATQVLCGHETPPTTTTTTTVDPNAQAPAAACPEGWLQRGDIGADIGGCGLQGCDERYDVTSEAACAERCDGNSECVGFSFAPMNGDRNHPGVTACTIYPSDTPSGTWTGTQGLATQVLCGRSPPPLADGDLRLSDGVRGRLEVYHSGEWGTVCDDGFDHNDATTACHQMGFPRDNAVQVYTHGGGEGPIIMDDLGCSGEEERLDQCQHRGWRSHNCGHHEDVGIVCNIPQEPTGEEGSLRLSGGSSSRGRLEIYHDGGWGTICDDHFAIDDANTACRQLGFSQGAVSSYTHGGGTGSIFLDDLACGSGDNRIDECGHRGWTNHNCGHHEDVGVECQGEPTADPNAPGSEGSLRLSDGSDSSGRLEVYHEGQWGTVCDDHFNRVDANTACRQLGFPNGATRSYTHGGGTGQIFLDDLGCTEVHDRIDECTHPGWGTHNCAHHEDVGIECTVFVNDIS